MTTSFSTDAIVRHSLERKEGKQMIAIFRPRKKNTTVDA
jgi:hypothetical protein